MNYPGDIQQNEIEGIVTDALAQLSALTGVTSSASQISTFTPVLGHRYINLAIVDN